MPSTTTSAPRSRRARPVAAAERPCTGAGAALVPVEYAVLGVALVGSSLWAEAYEMRALGAALLAVVAAIACTLVRRRPFRLLLVDVWAAAFAYLYASDLALTAAGVVATFGTAVTARAEAFVVGSFGASLAGAALCDAWLRRRTASRPVPARRALAARPSAALSAVLAATSLAAVAFVLFIVTPAELFATARVERSFGDTATRPMLVAALVMQPILAAYATRRHRARGATLVAAWLVAPLCALALYASGTRFYLGFMLCGVLYYAMPPLDPMPPRRAAAIALAALACLALQGTMRASRTVGLVRLEAAQLLSALAQPETFLSSEGLLRVNAWVHDKRAWESAERPFENGFILYWWVPRAVWSDKPAMEGRRLIEDVMDEGYFNPNHSVAGGFAMPALLDFGPHLGVAFSLLYGAGLATLARFAERHRDPRDRASPLVALLPFGVFFTARGLHTSVIFMALCTLWYLPVLLLGPPTRLVRVRLGGAEPRRAVLRRSYV